MIRDRAFALDKTAMFAPRHLRHIIGNLTCRARTPTATFARKPITSWCRCCRSRLDLTLHQVGVYYDVFHRAAGADWLRERRCEVLICWCRTLLSAGLMMLLRLIHSYAAN